MYDHDDTTRSHSYESREACPATAGGSEAALATIIDEAVWCAIAVPSRRQILDVMADGGEVTQTTLAAELPLTRQAIAKHLEVLTRTGLVERKRLSKEVHYRLRPDQVEAAATAMAAVPARWIKELEIKGLIGIASLGDDRVSSTGVRGVRG